MISNLSQVVPMTQIKAREPTTPISPSPAAEIVAQPVAENAVSAKTSAVTGTQTESADQDLAAAIDKLNSKVQNLNRNLEFSIDKDSGELVVKVVDAHTHEVIRQIPRKEALALASSIEQYMQDHHIGLVQTKA
jgi:flagellar protein FlaG